jgi:flagellar biosynthesis chaperone FliJ
VTRFKFRLEAALRLRRVIAEAESEKLQLLLMQRQKLEKSLAAAGEERIAARSFVQQTQGVRTADLRALSSFTIGLEARTQTLTEALRRTDTQIEEQRKRLLKAEQDERSLSKLRAKRLKEWTLQNEREIEVTAQELWLLSHTKDTEGQKSC